MVFFLYNIRARLEPLHFIIICATAEWWAKHWQKLQYTLTIQFDLCKIFTTKKGARERNKLALFFQFLQKKLTKQVGFNSISTASERFTKHD